jgi:hypothetical protein
MEMGNLGRILAICGTVAVGIAFLGWLALTAKVSNAGFGLMPLTCLLSTGGQCAMVYGVAQFENSLFPLIPVAFWLGALALVSGGIIVANAQDGQQVGQSSSAVPAYRGGAIRGAGQRRYDNDKWAALLRYDDEIRLAAEELRKYGAKYEAILAADYLQINDKSYLTKMAERIATLAREAPPEDATDFAGGLTKDFSNISNWRIDRGETLTPRSVQIVQKASRSGWDVEYWPNSNLMFSHNQSSVSCNRNDDIASFGDRVSQFLLSTP